ncbi:hypothetical protein LV716_17320 [Flagellimonas sp. HMM57]|uniref:hypothetical protein n=1 Tax=unclassified Flagellimonas TaxID=2644544 RepID=UPI0013D85B55|nr:MULTISPECIES: hypothetical protein [unclassified Flagellimonas]UII76003.1 hypothetical protein LV716_17320 [Flagellimonas sp. HMM57]
MRALKLLFCTSFCILLVCCKNTSNSDIIRNDLLREIEGFIALNEESISDFKNNRTDTDIYWVEFFNKDGKKVVVIMEEPFVYKNETDGFIKINENWVFFYDSNPAFVDVSKLEKSIGEEVPDENSKEAGLGFSAPNWAYYINADNSLEKFELGQ